jgi:CCR4-NOT transcription complex subunit 6
MIRQSRSPHHRARASAMASRTVAKSAIPITNPNLPKPDPNGASKDAENSTPGTNGTTGSSETTTPAVAANHPSAVAGPSEAPRLTAPKPPENNWTSLDMGGVNIKNLPPTSGLFSFTFLATLYLNHNQLSSIPPQISKLRHLELLDLSGNQLRTVPPELGMLTMLKELYLFDNHLTTIPFELGTLHQLQTLGIEGNPIEPSLKAVVQKDGTPALIAYLRDACPAPTLPPARQWENAVSQQERDAAVADPNTEIVSLLCYNVLCERAATAKLYGYTPSWALTWDYRKELILAEIAGSNADFLCLQEVDVAQYEEFFLENLSESGYDGAYWPKSRAKHMNEADKRLVDGCAIFFKKDK